MQAYLTVDDAAEILKTSGAAVRALIRAGELPAAKLGRRWLIDPADLETAFQAAKDKNAQRHVKTSS